MGTVIDIAKGVVFLASDDAALMNGTGLVLDAAPPRSDAGERYAIGNWRIRRSIGHSFQSPPA
jgi:hypothetical protein